MNLQSSQRIAFEPLRSLAFGDISDVYAIVGLPFYNPVRLLKLTNLTDATLTVSFDGYTDHDIVSGPGAWVYDFGANKNDIAGNLEQPAYTRFYVKQESSAPTQGTAYVTVIYASQN